MSAVRFQPMSEVEFAAYSEQAIPSYAAEHVRAGTYPKEGAVDRARAEWAKIVPQGTKTPGHSVNWIVDAASGARVGHLWSFVDAAKRQMFIYDIEILPEHRRRGYAEAAILALGPIGRAGGATTLGLHVFGHNTGAIALYEKLGFATTHRMMAKPL